VAELLPPGIDDGVREMQRIFGLVQDIPEVFVIAAAGSKESIGKKEEGLAVGIRRAGQGGHRFEQFGVGDGRNWRRHLCERNAAVGNPVDGVKRPMANGNEGSTPALGDRQARKLAVSATAWLVACLEPPSRLCRRL
jgi:hypothetical protein